MYVLKEAKDYKTVNICFFMQNELAEEISIIYDENNWVWIELKNVLKFFYL